MTTFAEVTAYLAEHKEDQEVKDYLAGLSKPTAEGVKAYLDTDEGKRILQPIIDRTNTQAIDTWKSNHLEKLVAELHDKKFPPEDEKDARIRALEEKDRKRDAELLKEKLRNRAITKATEKGLPLDFIDRFLGDDEPATDANIDAYAERFKAHVDAAVEARFKNNGNPPPRDGKPDPNEKNPWKAETRNLTEQGRISREDPEKAAKLKAAAGVK